MATSPATLTLTADQSEVKAGGTILLTAVLAHSGTDQGEYTLSIRGVDSAWVTFYPPTLSVTAGGQATATILVAPPVNAAAADLSLTVRAVSAATNAEAEATFSVRLTSTTGAATGRARRTGRLTWPRLLLLSAGVIVVVAAVGIFFLLHRHSSPPPQQTASCASQPTQLVDLYSDDTTTAIRISDPDLADVRILRTEPSDTLSPLFSSLLSLSPDGSHLTYVTAGNEALDDAHLWSLDVANPGQRQELATIPHGLWQVRPAWSPDNRHVAFLRLNEQQAAAGQTQLELWVADLGGQPHKVAAPPELRPDGFYGSATQPLCWAQDNQSVIFSSVTPNLSASDQGARATGSSQPTDNLNPATPQQIAVNVQTGATEQLATPVAATDAAPAIPAAPAGGAGCGLPVFSQNDPAWRNVIMQSSGDTIGRFGCAVTATAMLLNYYGTTLTPEQLNTCLGTNADLIQWASVVPCANGAITASNAFDFAWPSLDQVLASGNPAIVGMVRGQTGLHFVVVTAGGGGEATDYAVIDPWDGTTSKTLQTFLDAGYNLRWIRTYTGTDKACPRLVAPQTPAADASGIAPVPDGPLLAPSQLLPLFTKVADQTGIPRDVLLSIARIESGFTPRSVGPLIEKFSGTEDAHALGMMQFLPSTYRTYSAQVDAARAKSASSAGTLHTLSLQADTPAVTPLGDAGIWDPEASIWATAFFLQQHGFATDQRGAVFAYNNSNAYVDLVLKTAAQFKSSTIPDPNQYDPNATSKPGTLAAPNPINPPPLSAADAAAARPPAPKQASGSSAQANGGAAGGASGGSSGGGTKGGASGSGGGTSGTGGTSGGIDSGGGGTTVPIRWTVPEGSISRTAVILNFNASENIGQVTKLSLLTLTVPGSTASPVNESTPSRPITPGAVITDDGVYEAVAVTSQNGQTRVSRRKFTIDRTAPTLDLSVVTTGSTTATPGAGTAQAVTTADALHPVADGAIRLKIGYADTLSGVASVEYRLDGGDWQLYFSAVAFKGDALIDVPGDHTIRVRATDVAGNVSQERALDFTVKADPNKPFLDSGQPLLKPVSSISVAAEATTVAVVPSPTAITTTAVAAGVTATPAVAVTPTAAPPTATSTVGGTQQSGAPTLQLPTLTPTVRATPSGAAAAVSNVTPTATAGVTATVATTTPTVAVTPTVGVTATVAITATSTPSISPTPSQPANAITATPATTVTTTATVGVTATPGPVVKFTAPSCSDAAVRSVSSCTAVTITNAGTTDLRINNINTTGEFLIGDAGSSCTTALAPNTSCDVPILFIPTAIGKRVGTLTITDSAPGSPHTLGLAGNGIGAPAVAFAPPLFTCPDTELGRTSLCSITLTNTGSAALTIASGIVVTGDFSPDPRGTDCGLTLAVSAHCTLSIIFAPTVHGIRTGVMTVTDSAPGSPHPISITGKGLAPGVSLTAGFVVAPSSITCGDTIVGQQYPCIVDNSETKNALPLTLTNTGDGELDVSSIIPHDDYIKVSGSKDASTPLNCAVLQPNQQCAIFVTFAPTSRGTHVSGITFTDNALGSPQTVQVTGRGIAPVVTLSSQTQPVTCLSNSADSQFNGVVVGTSSQCGTAFTTEPPATTPLILTNSGDADLHISSIVPNDPFLTASVSQTTVRPCPVGDPTNTICQLQIPITFTPTERGSHTSGLTIIDDASGGTQSVPISVTGLAPVVRLSTPSVACPDTIVGKFTVECTPSTLTLTNDGDAPLNITSIVPSSDFAVSTPGEGTPCGAVLNGKLHCDLLVKFAPTVKGIHQGSLTIVDNAPGSPHTVQLTAKARAPLASLSVSSLTCPDTIVGMPPSTCPALTLTNVGDSLLTISSIVPADPFLTATIPQTSVPNCPDGQLITSVCQLPITIKFAPTDRGVHTSGLTITDDAIGGSQSVQIIAKGLAPVVKLSGTTLTCPDTVVGQPAAACLVPGTTPTPLTLTNNGDAPLNITSIVTGDDFKVDPAQCPQSLVANTACTLNVTFAPTTGGNHAGNLTIVDNAPGSPHTVQLTAKGLAPVVNLSAPSITCPDTIVGHVTLLTGPTACTPSTLTLTNIGDAILNIASITPSSDFTVATPGNDTNCGPTLDWTTGHNTCTLNVTFAPTVRGQHEGSLTIADDAAGSPHIVQLTAKALAPLASLSVSSLTCPDTIVGGPPSTCPALTLTNLGDAQLNIRSIVPADPFLTATVPQTFIPPCAGPVTAVCQLPITINFAPTERGLHTSGLTITDDAIGGTQSVQIIAKGLAPVATLSGTTLTCPDTVVGQPAAACLVPGTTPAPLTLTNNGDAPLNITSIVAGDDFKVNPTGCPQSLAVGAPACTLTVTFAPTTRGNHVGNLAIADNAPGTPQTLQLTAKGLAPVAVLSAPTLACQDTVVGQTGTCGTAALTLTNGGDAVMNISSIVASDDFKIAPASCPTTLAANANCTLTVTFVPTTRGNHVGNLTIADDAPGSPQTVQLSAKALAPVVTLSAQALICPDTIVGATATCGSGTLPSLLPFTLTNSGDATLNIGSIVAGDDFKISAPLTGTFCGTTLAGGATCGMQITFTPGARGTHISSLTVADNAPGTPHTVQLTAKALAPVVSLDASSLVCQDTIVGQSGTCGTGPLTLTNTGDAPLTISSIVPGTDFRVTPSGSGCGTTIAPNGGTCVLQVSFVPTTRGSHSAALTIADNAPGTPHSVQLTGNAFAPVATFSAQTLTCPDTAVGATGTCGSGSPPSLTPLTLTNTGDAPLLISSIVTNDDFKVAAGQCPASLGPAVSCTVQVTFAPGTAGSHVGSLTIVDSASGSPHSVQLTGVGQAAVATLSTQAVACGGSPVGTPVMCPNFTLTNTGTSPLTITSAVLSGDFNSAVTTSCGTTLNANSICTISVTFNPTAAGSRAGSLTLTDNAPGSTQSVALTGTGQMPVLSFSAQTLTCPDTAVGATGTCGSGSPPSLTPLTLTNTGDAPLTISSIVASDDFKVTAGQCPATLAVGSAACTVQVTFTPTSAGNHVGGLTVTDNASGSPHSVQLTATGLGPAVSLSPSPLVCGGTLIGTTVACPLVTVVNTGNAALTISNIVMDGNFTVSAPVSGGCGANLAANQTHDSSCTLQVTFGPTVAGSRVGSMTITDNAPGSPHAVALSGTGQAPVVSLSPASVACPSTGTAVGTTATCGTGLTLTNTGDAPLTISSIAANDDFKVTVPTSGGCGTTLAPTSSCALQVSFTPTTSGNHTGSITVVDNAAGSPHAVQLTGTATAPAVSFDVQSVSCPDTAIGGSNPCPVVTLTNSGNAPLHLTSITANSPFSGISNTCGTADLGAGANCKITVTFAPGAAGNLTGFLSVADNAPGSPHTLPLSGNGVGTPVATVTAAGTCPDTNVGATANCTTLVTVANAASATGNLVMSLITISSEFGINPTGSTCGTILTPGNNCVLAITFTPAADGQRNGAVTITDNAAGSPQSVNLTGKGLGTVAIAISPSTVTCPDTLVGTTASCPTRVTITNSGTAQLTLSQIALTGDYALDTLTNSTCGTAVAPGASCSLAISFKPTATGARPGTVAITDNAPASPQSVTLTGNGIQPGLTVSPASITCPATVVGITAVCSTTLTNPGTAPLTLAPSITAGGSDYQLHSGGTNACTASLAANNATCIMYVDFKPAATGARTGTLSLGDNAPGSPHTIALSGTGTQPTATLSTTAITCADTTTTTTGMCQQVVISNTGTGALTINSEAAPAPFGVDATRTTCGATLAVNASCTVAVFFTPTATGAATGTLTITDNAPVANSTQTVSLSGNGVAAAPALTASPTSATCPTVAAHSTSTCSTVTLTSTTAISSMTKTAAPAAEFAVSGTSSCGSTLAANTPCTLVVTFSPAEADVRDGTVTISYTTVSGTQVAVIPYSGTGT